MKFFGRKPDRILVQSLENLMVCQECGSVIAIKYESKHGEIHARVKGTYEIVILLAKEINMPPGFYVSHFEGNLEPLE